MKRRKLIVIAAVAAVLVAAYLVRSSVVSYEHGAQRPVDIPRGTSLRAIADSLATNDVIRDRTVFMLLARVTSTAERLQSGVYRFPSHVSSIDVLRILVNGSHQAVTRVTIREGLTIQRIATHLDTTLGFSRDAFVALCHDRRFIDSIGLSASSLEGYLLPDTYDIRYDATPRSTIIRLVKAMLAVFTEEYEERMKELRMNMHEILTMASIVEGETRVADERARVAGVYYNRLNIGMLLQADPTIQYIVSDSPRRILYRDLSINSPYNTYMYGGLPPGPVNNPGPAAIHAALYPESHEYYYFVADGEGRHTFTRNYEEHLRAVRRFREWRARQTDS